MGQSGIKSITPAPVFFDNEYNSMEVNWTSIVTVVLLSVGLSSGAAMAYLTLFINQKNHMLKENILNHIDEKFALKEIMADWKLSMKEDLDEIKKRMDGIEEHSRLNLVTTK